MNYKPLVVLLIKIYYCVHSDGHFDEYIGDQPLESVWREVKSTGGDWPSMRGGHQLLFDESAQQLYLHGGWDGVKELGDLWTFSVVEGMWKCLYQDTSVAVST